MNYHIKWLDNLQKTKETNNAVIFHSHPTEKEKRVYPEDTHKFLKFYNDKLIIYGHTHIPCTREENNLKVLNPGSVGQPRDGDSSASYGVIDSGELSLERVDYDKEKTIKDIKENKELPNSLCKRLR